MRTSLAPSASRTDRRAAALLAILLLSGCQADAGAAAQPTEGLLILTRTGVAELVVLGARRGGEDPVAIGLPVPAEDVTWVSAGRGGVLVGSTAQGDLATSDPVDPRGAAADLAGLTWTSVEATDDAGRSLPASAAFATWDPAGRRFAALGGDLLGGGDMTLLLVDPSAGKLSSIALDRPLLAAAPVWLDGERVGLVGGAAEEPASLVVDTASGKIGKGPAGERRLATSADASVIATSAGAGGPILLRSTKGWLADDGTSVGSVDVPDGFTNATSLALDATGRRLSIVWHGDDGQLRYDVHDGADGWRRVWSQPLTDASAAAVAWLR